MSAIRRRIVQTVKPMPTKRRTVPIRAVDSAEEAENREENAVTESDTARIVARYMARVKNPLTAIRARCVQCSNGQPHEVAHCPCTSCALHPFRMGTNPMNKKVRDRLAREAGATGNDDGE